MLQRGLPLTFLLAILLLPAAILVLPSPASAQEVEITPFVGYRFGGDLDEDTLGSAASDFEIDDATSSGIILAIGVARGLQVELSWSRQETELRESGGFFGSDEVLFDLDVDYYQAGVAYEWALGQVRPFISVGLGVAELDPGEPGLESESRFSVGLGGGVKLMFAKHLGLRLEGRLLAIALDDDDDFDDYCNRRNCDDSALAQGELRAGLVFAF